MKLEELVPPLELCKMIPDGEFGDSALVWFQMYQGEKHRLRRRDLLVNDTNAIPAPTLEEIMAKLPHDDAYNNLLLGYSEKVDKFTGWHIYYSGDRKRHCYDKRAVTAALKLWLKMRGINNEK